MKTLDQKIKELLELNSNQFLYVEYYSHTGKDMWKIDNVYTKYAKNTIVLEDTSTPFEEVVDLAIIVIIEAKSKFFLS